MRERGVMSTEGAGEPVAGAKSGVGQQVRRAAFVVLAVVGLLAAALGFGMTPGDARRVRAFGDAVRGWQSNPDYRAVSAEYVTLGVEAMKARLCGISAGHVIMAFRSIPGLPDHLAIGETSAAHYDAFLAGELSAYLHLASEQGFADGIALVEDLGRRNPLTDDDVVTFLAGFKLPVPTVTDAGAVAGTHRLLADVQSDKPFAIRGDVVTPLRSIVDQNLEQAAAFAQFDAQVRAADPELWRAKQVNDFLAGIWAQGYGQIYLDGIDGFFFLRRLARTTLVIVIVAALVLAARARHTSTVPDPTITA